MQVRVVTYVEAPEGASHFSGDLLDEPTWWKQSTNSTGVITAWYFWSAAKSKWYFQSEHQPHWLEEIPT